MTQSQEFDSIHKFVMGAKIASTNNRAIKLKEDWKKWFGKLNWVGKTTNKENLTHARAFKDEFIAALAGKGPLFASDEIDVGADISTTQTTRDYSKPGSQVPNPGGYRRATQKEITRNVLSFARAALQKSNPRGLPQGKVIGNRLASNIEGKVVIAQIEWHYDNHPKGKGPPFWHMGMSIFMPSNDMFAASDAGKEKLMQNV
jgi:hypothetical protein